MRQDGAVDRNGEWGVAPGYERVAEEFLATEPLLGSGGGAFAVLLHGRPVVDLWGGEARPGQPWERDTLGVAFSMTKGLVGLVLMLLVDRGLLSLDDLVTDHWPEYGQAGKERTTVAMVLMHTCGAIGLPGHTDLVGMDGTGFDRYDDIAARIAASPPAWEPGTKQGYHAITYGWIVGELVRRITGRTVGTYFHDEVAVPLGLDTWIGTPPEALPRVARVTDVGYHAVPGPMRGMVTSMLAATRDPRTLNGQVFLGDGTTSIVDHMGELLSMDRVLAAEFASGNGTTTARSLARAFALLGNGGELDGIRLFSEETDRAFQAVTSSLPDELARELATGKAAKRAAEAPVLRVGPNLGNTTGRLSMPDMMGPNPKAAGAGGAGAQVVFFDREHGLAVAYLRSHMAAVDLQSPRLVAAAYRCATRNGDIDASDLPKVGPVRRVLQRPIHAYLAKLERRSFEPAARSSPRDSSTGTSPT
jgi:CubicO group peptidase (beta-lactamase class C family)